MMMVLAPSGGIFITRPATVIESTGVALTVTDGNIVANRTVHKTNKRGIGDYFSNRLPHG